MFDIKKDKWEESYSRGENFMYYPKEEVIKFLNRFIKKKISLTEYVELLNSQEKLKALDFGCGIGRTTILLHEFNIDGYGIDISQNAINEAISFGKNLDFELDDFLQVYNGSEIPFNNDYFDFTISMGVLDSMPFSFSQVLMKEIDRVTKKYCFISLISDKSSDIFDNIKCENSFDGEIVVEEKHEEGTVQSFFNKEKINKLIKNTGFTIKWSELHSLYNQKNGQEYTHGRWYLLLEKG